MRMGIFLAVVFLGILHRASSVPHGILPPSAYAVGHDTSLQVPKAPADECKNISSSDSQKCGTKTVTHEKTVITIEKTVETEITNGENCSCPGDKCKQCKDCCEIGTTTEAPVTTPPTTPVPCTSTTPQTPTVPTTSSATTTTVPPTSPTTPQTPTVPTTSSTTTTTVPPTSPTTPQTPTVPTTSPTTTTTVPPTSPTTPQTPTVPTTPSTTTTTAPPTSPTTPQTPTVPTTSSTTTTTVPPTSPTTPQTPTVPTTPSTTTTTSPPTSPTTPPVTKKPEQCNANNCRPPQCWCESPKPPVEDMPQFVMLTFDDAVRQQNMEFYHKLLADPKRKNKASGCRIAVTFFVSAEYLDYPSVNNLYRMGNEIALHSISHQTDGDGHGNYWNDLNTTGWEAEVVHERRMVEKFAKVPERDIRGLRGPFLFTGGDAGFRMLHSHFYYDCTLIHKRDGPDDAPVFPYTLDYGFQKPCMVHKCPNDTYPGLWTVPLNYLFGKDKVEGVDKYNPCSMADACLPQPETSQDFFEYLRFNFESFYNTNRAPFPVFLHEASLDKERKEGYLRFVDWLLEKEDVYLVTVSEVLDFMRDPKSRSSYSQRRCTKGDLPESTCPKSTNCHYPTTPLGAERYMRICGTTCPKNYPWVNNPDGN